MGCHVNPPRYLNRKDKRTRGLVSNGALLVRVPLWKLCDPDRSNSVSVHTVTHWPHPSASQRNLFTSPCWVIFEDIYSGMARDHRELEARGTDMRSVVAASRGLRRQREVAVVSRNWIGIEILKRVRERTRCIAQRIAPHQVSRILQGLTYR